MLCCTTKPPPYSGRSASLGAGLGAGDLALNFGTQYLMPARRWEGIFWNQRRASAPVPGLVPVVDIALHVVAGQQRIDPIEAADNRFVFCLPADTADIRIVSHAAVSRIRLRDDDDCRDLPATRRDSSNLMSPASMTALTDGNAVRSRPRCHMPHKSRSSGWPTAPPPTDPPARVPRHHAQPPDRNAPMPGPPSRPLDRIRAVVETRHADHPSDTASYAEDWRKLWGLHPWSRHHRRTGRSRACAPRRAHPSFRKAATPRWSAARCRRRTDRN
jgi:hypothetical protein